MASPAYSTGADSREEFPDAFATPVGSEDQSVHSSLIHQEPAAVASASLVEIMKRQEDTKARSYLSNLLGDLGRSTKLVNF